MFQSKLLPTPVTSDWIFRQLTTHFANTPDKIAIVDGDFSLSWRQLDQASSHLALKVKESGAPLPRIIPVIGQRSAAYLVSVLACWKLGVAFTPVSDETPVQRLKYILAESQSSLIINCSENWQGQLAGDCTVITTTNSQLEFHCDNTVQFPAFDVDATQLAGDVSDTVRLSAGAAYVIFTSGTTGKPKGCVIGFESLSPMVAAYCEHYAISENSRVTMAANIAFDASVLEYLQAFVTGATVYILDKATLLNPVDIVEFYRQHTISFAWLPTPVAEVLMTMKGVELPSSLVCLQTAGQRLSVRPPGHWHTQVENAYGPTENDSYCNFGLREFR